MVIFNLELNRFKTDISKCFARQGSNFYSGDPVDRFGLHGMLKVVDGYKRYVDKKNYFNGCENVNFPVCIHTRFGLDISNNLGLTTQRVHNVAMNHSHFS